MGRKAGGFNIAVSISQYGNIRSKIISYLKVQAPVSASIAQLRDGLKLPHTINHSTLKQHINKLEFQGIISEVKGRWYYHD